MWFLVKPLGMSVRLPLLATLKADNFRLIAVYYSLAHRALTGSLHHCLRPGSCTLLLIVARLAVGICIRTR